MIVCIYWIPCDISIHVCGVYGSDEGTWHVCHLSYHFLVKVMFKVLFWRMQLIATCQLALLCCTAQEPLLSGGTLCPFLRSLRSEQCGPHRKGFWCFPSCSRGSGSAALRGPLPLVSIRGEPPDPSVAALVLYLPGSLQPWLSTQWPLPQPP